MGKNRQSIGYKKGYWWFFWGEQKTENPTGLKFLSGLKFYKLKNYEAISNRFNKFLFKVLNQK
jgi:hypothetical protein